MPTTRHHRLDAFFFAPRSALGFGLMRIGWAGVTLLYLLFQWREVALYYSDAGYLPHNLEPLMLRGLYRFTLLHWFTAPQAVYALYVSLLVLLFLTMIGRWTRLSMVGAFVLLLSFHERDPLPLAGGETVLRALGFLLAVSPGIRAVSLDRLREQRRHWNKAKKLLHPLQMPMWPYRLLLWQVIVLYSTSLWYKMLGTMWLNGTAVAAVLHHPWFSRVPPRLADLLATPSVMVTYAVVLWHACWFLLLIPKPVFDRFAFLTQATLKRALLLGGLLFHGSIYVLMRAGSFSLTVFCLYLGLLDPADLQAIRTWFHRGRKPARIAVLYDGRCGLCQRSIFALRLMDWLGALTFVDFWNKAERGRVAVDLTEKQLDKAMHVRFVSTKVSTKPRTYKGFDALRAIAWHLPPLWLAAPFLYLPGIPLLGRNIYENIAARRKRCKHEQCAL